ncbi:mechanosensitive ion channel family protein [Hyphomonas sp.]|jgi:potassium efflux system protein|uniref:mechanosensitive ion channel family protein n=1 Tax=Hyphomonas sp. TaxID=87 RepID=UPI0039E22463
MNPEDIEIDADAVAKQVGTMFDSLMVWFQGVLEQALSIATLWQIGIIVAASVAGWLLSRLPNKRLHGAAEGRGRPDALARVYLSLASVMWPLISVVFIWAAFGGFAVADLPNVGLRIAASLLAAWVIIRLLTSNMKKSLLSRSIALIAWTVAALYILQWLEPTVTALNDFRIPIGKSSISAWRILTSVAIAIAALWFGRIAGATAQSRLRSNSRLNPSMAGLLGQVANILLMVVAIAIALQTVGVNLSALTIFSGALGVGIGFGLQSIFSNFISGVIILIEKSVKVGDFIELQSGVTGLVNEINIRSTVITTNDNVDILVPNEEFIKAQVINWTLREARRRTHIKFGVAYGTDKDLVRQAGMEAAAEVKWTLENMGPRMPQVWLVGFGDSSLDFELVVWLTEEAVKKPSKVVADYNWAIHSALERHGIEIPFPQQDLHVKSSDAIRVRIETGGSDEAPSPDTDVATETEKAPKE